MFNKFFRRSKKEQDNSSKVDWLLNESVLTFHNGNAFMHYFDNNTKKNKLDPSWQNQGIYFWKESEEFDKKSLPDDFLKLDKKFFLIENIPAYIEAVSGKAMPWFGKPGGGEKFFFRYEGEPITLEEAKSLNIIAYFEYIKLDESNLSVLNDRDGYMFLLKSDEIEFINKELYYKNNKTSVAELYSKNLIRIIKI